jgi:hypothetical protein
MIINILCLVLLRDKTLVRSESHLPIATSVEVRPEDFKVSFGKVSGAPPFFSPQIYPKLHRKAFGGD